jgi:DNA-binding transcriptional ArsR family regulator
MSDTAPILSVDRNIHEPARFAIMMHLYVVQEADFVLLQRQTGLSAGNLSSHMSRLEDAGYVHVSKTFVGKRPQTNFRLSQLGRTAFDTYRRTVTAALQKTRSTKS